MEAQDLDGDQQPELIALQSKPGEVLIYWHGIPRVGTEMPEHSCVALGVDDVANLTIIDHNRDGRPDLIATGGTKEEIGTRFWIESRSGCTDVSWLAKEGEELGQV